MGLYKKLAAGIDEVDVIIAGGGTAGCIIAGRLAEADPGLSILVVEGGPDNYDNPKITIPGLYQFNLVPDSETVLYYKAAGTKQLAGKERIVPSGGVLGGGSAINFMMYARAQREDFDSWKTPGWTADDMLPYLKKLETYHGPGNPETHGSNGPIHVSEGPYRSKRFEDEWMRTAEQSGYPEIPDLQSLDSNNGFQRWLRYMSPDGERSDTAHAYLHPLLRDGKHPNLHVLVQSKVVRVLFDEHKRACGVEFTPNPQFQMVASYATPHPKQTVRARKLVIVTCGACGTPSVLERSGLGAKDVLERAAVPLVEELPGIGHDYQDHQLVAYVYKSSLKPEETADALLTGRLSVEDAIAQKHPHLQWNFIDIASKLRPTEAEVAALGPEFQAAWDRDFKDKPNRPLILMASCAGTIGDTSGMPPNEYISVGPYTAYPYSRGHMHITGPDVTDAPDFDLGFFSDAHDVDLKKQVWAYKKSREMMRRSGVYAGELAAFHPRFPAGSAAACIEDWDAAGGAAPPTHAYTAEDDAAIEQHLRENAQTAWHALGTAKMAPREDMGVVDASLSVYGVKGLKVADLSIVPENVGANTNNTAMAVGEKAADIIAKELGLTPS